MLVKPCRMESTWVVTVMDNPKKMTTAETSRRHREKNLEKRNLSARESARRRRAREPEVVREYRRKWSRDHPEKVRASNIKYQYGLSREQYDALFTGLCAACGAVEHGGKGWHVDHDHETGRVRGVLCHSCNVALGMLKDSAYRVSALLQYIGDCDHG